jgi:hypothetical protein
LTGVLAWQSSGAKRRKIMLADSSRGRLAHRLKIERQVVPANPPLPQAGPLRPVEQQIAIAPAARAEPGVEFLRQPAAPSAPRPHPADAN